jgi:hypothetical protein
MIKPISPDAVEKKLNEKKYIPGFVFEGFNACILAEYNNGWARVYQDDVINAILKSCANEFDRQTLFDSGWLDVEPHY